MRRQLDCAHGQVTLGIYLTGSKLLRSDQFSSCALNEDLVTMTQFCSIGLSMPVYFCRHLVGKNSEKCLSL